MDQTDKRIVFNLLKNGRVSQRQIASDLGISAQVLNYRMNKLIEDGIIKNFFLHVNQRIYGKMEEFAAFKTEKQYDGEISLKLNCLEEITLYGFLGASREELNQKIARATEALGPPVMRYMPPPPRISMNIRDLDFKIIELLKKDPRMSISNIAAALNVPYMSVKRRINLMEENRVIGVITQVDLSGGELVLYSIFSKSVDRFFPSLAQSTIFAIRDASAGFALCYADSLKTAKSSVTKVREQDPGAEVMVLYDYEFYQ